MRTSQAAEPRASTRRPFGTTAAGPPAAAAAPRFRLPGISADAVPIVRFIKRAQELGFSLDEVEELVRLRGVKRGERHKVRALAEQKIADIDRRIEQLGAMRAALGSLVESCHHGGAADCPIIEALNHD